MSWIVDEPGLPSLRFRPLVGRAGYFIIGAGKGDRIILREDGDDLFAAVDGGPDGVLAQKPDLSASLIEPRLPRYGSDSELG